MRTRPVAAEAAAGAARTAPAAAGAAATAPPAARRSAAAGRPPGPRRRVSPALTLTAALLGMCLITVDATVVNVALPAMGRDLHGGLSSLQWVVDGYTLVFAALMLSTGALSDRIGASRAFAGGVAVFAVASLACGLSPGLPVLIASRVVQGAAASVMMPSSLALVRQAFPEPAKRARAISLWAAGGSTALALGPIAGGALISAWSWRGIFFINLPIGLLALLMLARTERSERRPAPLDVPGQLTAVTALGALTFAVIEGGRAGLVALVLAVAAAVAFVVAESRHPHPVAPPALFRNAALSISIAAGAAFSFAFYGMIFLFSLYLQQVRGRSALATGLIFLPMTGLISVVNVVSGKVANRYGPRPPMIVGQALVVAGLLLLLPVSARTPLPLLALAMVPLGLGGALAVPPLTTAAMEAVPSERAGVAAGMLNAGRQVAGGLSVAVFGVLVADRAHFIPGMRTSLLVAAVLVAAATAATAFGPRTAPRVPGPAGPAGRA
jgi:DHA2 family methylenomycin A resistance protein-like MFS transporter